MKDEKHKGDRRPRLHRLKLSVFWLCLCTPNRREESGYYQLLLEIKTTKRMLRKDASPNPVTQDFIAWHSLLSSHEAIHSLVLLENNEPCVLWYQINGVEIERMLMTSQLEKGTKFSPKCKRSREWWEFRSGHIVKIPQVEDICWFSFTAILSYSLMEFKIKGNLWF